MQKNEAMVESFNNQVSKNFQCYSTILLKLVMNACMSSQVINDPQLHLDTRDINRCNSLGNEQKLASS
jgi:hypothetical protein